MSETLSDYRTIASGSVSTIGTSPQGPTSEAYGRSAPVDNPPVEYYSYGEHLDTIFVILVMVLAVYTLFQLFVIWYKSANADLEARRTIAAVNMTHAEMKKEMDTVDGLVRYADLRDELEDNKEYQRLKRASYRVLSWPSFMFIPRIEFAHLLHKEWNRSVFHASMKTPSSEFFYKLVEPPNYVAGPSDVGDALGAGGDDGILGLWGFGKETTESGDSDDHPIPPKHSNAHKKHNKRNEDGNGGGETGHGKDPI